MVGEAEPRLTSGGEAGANVAQNLVSVNNWLDFKDGMQRLLTRDVPRDVSHETIVFLMTVTPGNYNLNFAPIVIPLIAVLKTKLSLT